MARNTRMKLAALATTLVATLGVVAIAPASGADAGKTYSPTLRSGGGDSLCC
jgi:hypothetical protein